MIYYHRRRQQNVSEKKAIIEQFKREILQSQIEIQNQTLQQVGRELHDHIGQLLSVAMLHLNGLDEELEQSEHRHAIEQTINVVRTTIQDVRALSKTLDSDTVRRFGLRQSLALELERIERTGRFRTYLHVAGTPYPLGEEAETILFRMTQESLNNAIKHSGGQAIMVTTSYQSDHFELIITDDGKGFDVNEVSTRTANTVGSGLRNLQQRARLLGGTCTISSEPGQQTRVDIVLPKQAAV
ncbi:sensor histidine kinase [Fibrisoma limi]|uniref:sensor histidine kinase n=1 Tax=Fibrisoma limi TaxID=663275 RepID=UPI00286E5C9C|nr:sensor histidine kinase [Fibrisoma limi]